MTTKYMTMAEREYRRRVKATYRIYTRLLADGCKPINAVAQTAKRLGCSKRTVYNHLEAIKKIEEQ